MTRLITIINPNGDQLFTDGTRRKKQTKKRKGTTMLKRRKSRKSTKRRTVAKRRSSKRSYKKRRNPSYKTRRQWSTRAKRRSYKKRRNPSVKKIAQSYFGKARMMRAVGIIVGLGGSAAAKQFVGRMVNNDIFNRAYGLLSIVAGATMNMKGRKPLVKSAGTGMVAYGVLDLLVSNIPALGDFLPGVATPSALMNLGSENIEGNLSYGRSTMGANLSSSQMPEIVGSNIGSGSSIEVVGDDLDLAEALEMYV